MNLTPEQQAIGRRNFLKAVAGVPALAGLGAAAASAGPCAAARCGSASSASEAKGRVLLAQVDPAYATVAAMADINPSQLAKSDEVLQKQGRPAAKHYAEWQDMIAHEDIEGVVVAVPLWAHADIVVRVPRRGQARAVREDDGVGRRGLRTHAADGAEESEGPGDRLSAQLQPDVPGRARRHHQDGPARRRLSLAHSLAQERQLAASGRAAVEGLQPVEVGLPDVRAPLELAALQALLARAHRGAGQPRDEHRQLVLRRGARRR